MKYFGRKNPKLAYRICLNNLDNKKQNCANKL